MADRPPVRILLPTTRWTDACRELAAQLKTQGLRRAPDHPNVEYDPVTEQQNTPEGIQLVAAGEPECCSETG